MIKSAFNLGCGNCLVTCFKSCQILHFCTLFKQPLFHKLVFNVGIRPDQGDQIEEKGKNEDAVSTGGKNRTKSGIYSVQQVYSRDWG